MSLESLPKTTPPPKKKKKTKPDTPHVNKPPQSINPKLLLHGAPSVSNVLNNAGLKHREEVEYGGLGFLLTGLLINQGKQSINFYFIRVP